MTKQQNEDLERKEMLRVALLRAYIPLVLSIPEAAEVLTVSESTVWQYVWAGKLKARRLARSKRRIIHRDDLEKFLEQ